MYLLLVSPEPEHEHYDEARFPEMLRARLEEFEGIIGEIRDNLSDDDEIVFSPLSEVMLPSPWSQGRVLIAGDAAHACTPHITQGAAMALEDAVILPEEISKSDASVPEILVSFAERRYPRAKFVQDVSRGILESEMSITEETLPIAVEHMAAELPGQMAQVDEFLNQPA
jgi:2-polyprenyl-6-methoxyphenol hydroxylase-like FAD-dependent oxidoreductase